MPWLSGADRAEFGARQAGHDACMMASTAVWTMLVIDRQHVDADARAQRPMQRQPQVQRVQAVDPDGATRPPARGAAESVTRD